MIPKVQLSYTICSAGFRLRSDPSAFWRSVKQPNEHLSWLFVFFFFTGSLSFVYLPPSKEDGYNVECFISAIINGSHYMGLGMEKD